MRFGRWIAILDGESSVSDITINNIIDVFFNGALPDSEETQPEPKRPKSTRYETSQPEVIQSAVVNNNRPEITHEGKLL